MTPITVEDIKRSLDTISEYDRGQKLTLDDKGISACFADSVKDRHRYNVSAKCWAVFDGTKWVNDTGNVAISERAKSFVSVLSMYASRVDDDAKKTNYQRFAAKYGQLRFRQTMIQDASTVYPLSRADFDREKNLLNLRNGTFDLDAMEFYEHSADDLLSKCADVIFDPDAKCELWERFIDEIMEGDKEKVAYLQRLCGLCLTADVDQECLWFLYGPSTRNGKSTFIETISRLLGDYAVHTSPETLSQRKRQAGAASGDIARFAGCRLLTASEPPKRMLLDVALVKTLTGRDTITARYLYEREFQFVPEFKLLINTNSLPVVSDDTLFSSNRVRVIEFPHHFTEAEQDPSLKRKLTTPKSLSGILNWCLDGLLEYRKIGECPPDAVKSATSSYQKSSDKIALFMQEALEPIEGHNTAGIAAYEAFKAWCDDAGFGVDSKSAFFNDLRGRGLLAETGTVAGKTQHNVIKGFRIRPIWA